MCVFLRRMIQSHLFSFFFHQRLLLTVLNGCQSNRLRCPLSLETQVIYIFIKVQTITKFLRVRIIKKITTTTTTAMTKNLRQEKKISSRIDNGDKKDERKRKRKVMHRKRRPSRSYYTTYTIRNNNVN